MFINIILFSLFSFVSSHAGFTADTLIKTKQSYIEIEQATVGNAVTCMNIDKNHAYNIITHKHIQQAKNYITIVLDKDVIVCSLNQKIYLPIDGIFKEAQQLKVGDFLLSYSGEHIPIRDIVITEHEKEFCDISVHECHTFFVSRSEILVHNFAPVFIGLSWAFGSGAIEFTGATLGTLLWGASVGFKIHRDSTRETGYNCCITFQEDDINNSYQASDAQAPGKPTANDGYEPPKNWDGKKVKHPKTGQYGYLDKKGNIWVPTGPGPLAHGGPHWDVIYPNGKDYDNVYPGGKVRKGKK